MIDETHDHPTDEPWMTTAAAALYLSCSPTRVRHLVKLGRLRSARDVRRLVFKKSWLDDALDPGSAGTT